MSANHHTTPSLRIKREAGTIFLEPSPRWIRGYSNNGTKVVDSKQVFLGWEGDRPIPFWAFPRNDILQKLVDSPNTDGGRDGKRDKWYHIHLDNGEVIENAAWNFKSDTPGFIPEAKNLVVIDFSLLDKWLEDEERVVGHARSPYSGIHTRLSSRKVRVVIEGVTVAETNRAIFLYENGLPTRYYIDAPDIKRIDLFTPSTYLSACAYKGVASYFSANINGKEIANIAWTYLDPAPEVSRIQGRWSFWNETVDIFVDDEEVPRPPRRIVHTSP